jgi:dolichol-phosphate mannosyltransferase
MKAKSIAVVIPCYKVKEHIIEVLSTIPPEVDCIYVIDDACPMGTGAYVEQQCTDARVKVLYHAVNQGVGGAVITGYKEALKDDVDIIVKIDGDGQMDNSLIPVFIRPIRISEADYTKGNRFYHPEDVKEMPLIRLMGNAVLSLCTKFSAGYWNIVDPTNGFTAIDARILHMLPLSKIDQRYFFESDMLFRLNIIGAVIMDIPVAARYGNEVSNLTIKNILRPFIAGHCRNTFKRLFYNYFLRNMSIATFELVFGVSFILFGAIYGASAWATSIKSQIPTTSGAVMIAALPIITGIQMLLAFIAADIESVPKIPLIKRLKRKKR